MSDYIKTPRRTRYKNFVSRNTPVYLALKHARRLSFSEEALERITLKIDFKDCRIPRMTGGILPPGLFSGPVNELKRKYTVRSSTPWIKVNTPEPYFVYDATVGISKVNLASPIKITRGLVMTNFFNKKIRVCCDPKWLGTILGHCWPLTTKEYTIIDIECHIEQLIRTSTGRDSHFGRVLHSAIKVKPDPIATLEDREHYDASLLTENIIGNGL